MDSTIATPDTQSPMTHEDDTTRAFSMSESLAFGLVKRMIAEHRESYEASFTQKIEGLRKEKITTIPTKRCAAYRFKSKRIIELVPKSHTVVVHTKGKQDGSDRHAQLSIIHWHPSDNQRKIMLAITFFTPNWKIHRRWELFELTTHAMQRLFYRLKCVDQAPIFRELNDAVHRISSWYSFIAKLIYSCPHMSVGVPTPLGLLYVKAADEPRHASPIGLIASTWVSDTRMEDRPEKLETVKKARAHHGFVIQYGDSIIAVTQEHCLNELSKGFEPYDFPFFDEMLKFLPDPVSFV